jgi:hypothetical protein
MRLDGYFADMDRAEGVRGMIVTESRALDPALQGYTPHVPTQTRLNRYLDIFNDADIVAQRATAMPLTAEKTLNVTAPLLYHFGPPPNGWESQSGMEMSGLGVCAPGDEFCDSRTQQQQSMMTRVQASPQARPTTSTLLRTSQSVTRAYVAPTLLRPTATAVPAYRAPAPQQPPTYAQPAPQQQPVYAQPAQPQQPVQQTYDSVRQPLDPSPSAGAGPSSFPWWILLALGGGYLALQRR